MATNEHREKAKSQRARCAVLTISDTRTADNDTSGQIIQRTLQDAGHVITAYRIVKDEPPQIEQQLRDWLATGDIDLICCTGGTGITHRDTTVEVVRRLLTKELEGFGELFRMLSFQQVGPAAMLSRAVGGLACQTLLFAMPGSAQAVELAMTQLITPELPHLIWERKR
jgi:molybdenum cofactor biosynthesis protein B